MKRRTRIIRIFPNDKSFLGLIKMMCIEYS
ncbi:MAG: hypothetical protein H0Z29_10965 [Candidatus Marinimicrobia bacterium]|nr:hypothetical protein [Candidatus Neomarinimicrobiota bacterium]